MAARKRGGGTAGAGGIVALVLVLLSYTGNLGVVLDAVADATGGAGRHTSGSYRPARQVPDGASVTGTSGAPVPIPDAVTAPTAAQARAALAALPVTGRPPADDPTYRRADYGGAWTDVDGNGCDQRADVLYLWIARDRPSTVRRSGRCAHEVYAGTWRDPYTGRTITLGDAKDRHQSTLVQIDHLVPLSEAHKSGASGWDARQRLTLANDLTNLTPVYGPTNTSKSDSDPAAWRPRKQYQCDYARRYVAVKAKYRLSVDGSEKAALLDMLDRCP